MSERELSEARRLMALFATGTRRARVTALRHANRSHAAATGGDTGAYATTQLIVLTRLIRAVAALAIIDSRRIS